MKDDNVVIFCYKNKFTKLFMYLRRKLFILITFGNSIKINLQKLFNLSFKFLENI